MSSTEPRLVGFSPGLPNPITMGLLAAAHQLHDAYSFLFHSEQRLTKFFCKGPDSQYFRLCGQKYTSLVFFLVRLLGFTTI